jgi:predicted dehydrogenase
MKDFVWGIIGPGWIATEFTGDFKRCTSASHKIGPVLGLTLDSAKEFCEKEGGQSYFDDIEKFLQQPMDAVYIATPHPLHYKDTLVCLQHKIPVLCEKPIAVNNIQYEKMKTTARENETFLMEGMWIRFLPSIIKPLEILKSGKLGKITGVKSNISYPQKKDPNNRFYNPELGGGTLLDLGSYCVYLIHLLLGKPLQIDAKAKLSDKQIDTDCQFSFHYNGSVTGIGHSTFNYDQPNVAHIYCEKGKIVIGDEWNAKPAEITVTYNDGTIETITPEWDGHGFQYEIDEVCQAIASGKGECEKHSLDFTTDVMQSMDEIRKQTGIIYPYDADPEAEPKQ